MTELHIFKVEHCTKTFAMLFNYRMLMDKQQTDSYHLLFWFHNQIDIRSNHRDYIARWANIQKHLPMTKKPRNSTTNIAFEPSCIGLFLQQHWIYL